MGIGDGTGEATAGMGGLDRVKGNSTGVAAMGDGRSNETRVGARAAGGGVGARAPDMGSGARAGVAGVVCKVGTSAAGSTVIGMAGAGARGLLGALAGGIRAGAADADGRRSARGFGGAWGEGWGWGSDKAGGSTWGMEMQAEGKGSRGRDRASRAGKRTVGLAGSVCRAEGSGQMTGA